MSEPYRTSTTLYERFRIASITNIATDNRSAYEIFLDVVGVLCIIVITLCVAFLASVGSSVEDLKEQHKVLWTTR